MSSLRIAQSLPTAPARYREYINPFQVFQLQCQASNDRPTEDEVNQFWQNALRFYFPATARVGGASAFNVGLNIRSNPEMTRRRGDVIVVKYLVRRGVEQIPILVVEGKGDASMTWVAGSQALQYGKDLLAAHDTEKLYIATAICRTIRFWVVTVRSTQCEPVRSKKPSPNDPYGPLDFDYDDIYIHDILEGICGEWQ